MGLDISYHPVDVKFLHEWVIPYVRGERDLDDLWAPALRIARVRFRANAWGLGLLKLQHESPIRGFDSDLHVWGRPFFIIQESPAEVSEAIDRYLQADESDVDGIAHEMIRRLDPALVERVAPDTESVLPEDEAILRDIFWKIDLFARGYRAIKSGQGTIEHDGQQLDSAELFATDFPLAAFTFMAHFRPGWMSRGNGYPTNVLASAGVPAGDLFQSSAPLFAPLIEELPQVAANLDSTITQNYMVGGFVAAGRVGELQSLMSREEGAIRAWAEKEGWMPDFSADLAKMKEAVEDAAHRGMAFAEATEVYSAPLGIVN